MTVHYITYYLGAAAPLERRVPRLALAHLLQVDRELAAVWPTPVTATTATATPPPEATTTTRARPQHSTGVVTSSAALRCRCLG